ncbi:MAG: YciI family protein [Ilumatobacteraceae bacterium]
MRFSYVYFMAKDPDRVRAVAPEHAAYWRGLDLPSYLGGPFADRSGGLITFDARSVEEAEQLAANDPFVVEGLLANRWLKEWHAE